ncbi:RPM1-interacting protein 4-like isoform X2 [Phoenix dactylifera]|uniref:RPM1-interacting protein 4-like isoform X2 n=1 Tax=Phoenix dactylifera TaxID=42345 RepID=A0A8B7MUQ5_PHODC|nr:RPM1-interacting protein 4-like isoform X2 [Phoenix dactylifera]
MAQAHVPKFGNWETASTVPYTQYFENARKNKGGAKMINPNDPDQNPEAYADDVSPVQAPPVRAGTNPGAPGLKDGRSTRREDGDFRRTTELPLRNEAMGRKPPADPPHRRHGDRGSHGRLHERPGKINAGDPSSLHPSYQARSGSRGGAHASSLERKVSSEGHGPFPTTPGRSRKKSGGQGYETPEKDLTVPRFGAWDESNPSSGDNYTGIFNKLREIRASPTSNATDVPSYSNGRQRDRSPENKKCSCLSWLGK